jgi:hypothetical protein
MVWRHPFLDKAATWDVAAADSLREVILRTARLAKAGRSCQAGLWVALLSAMPRKALRGPEIVDAGIIGLGVENRIPSRRASFPSGQKAGVSPANSSSHPAKKNCELFSRSSMTSSEPRLPPGPYHPPAVRHGD